MPADHQQPYVDTQTLQGTDTYVYETVATLEYQGGPVTRDQILSVTDLDDAVVREGLRRLTESQVLLETDTDGGPRYELARRDWSVTPDIPNR